MTALHDDTLDANQYGSPDFDTPSPTVDMVPMRVTLAMLEQVFDTSAIMMAVREALISHAAGQFVLPPPTHLMFAHGDCHVKSGFVRGGDTFTVKIATGFHDNRRFGLPNASGLVILCSQRTGMPLAIIEDRGFLTAWRTVAATVAAAQAGAPRGPLRVGIIGTGLQAELAAAWLPAFLDVAELRIWGRAPDRAAAMAHRLGGGGLCAEVSLAGLAGWANLLVTTTSSTAPLLMADDIRPGTHIVALGADAPGKVEIDPALVARCATIMTDDHDQCLDHGDFGSAVRSGHVASNRDVALGSVLAGDKLGRPDELAITLADLTGLAAQDDAIARLFHDRLSNMPVQEEKRR